MRHVSRPRAGEIVITRGASFAIVHAILRASSASIPMRRGILRPTRVSISALDGILPTSGASIHAIDGILPTSGVSIPVLGEVFRPSDPSTSAGVSFLPGFHSPRHGFCDSARPRS
jgi:hypothetical protein